jgi:hypothetical protein
LLIPIRPTIKPNTPAISPFTIDSLERLPIIVSPNKAIRKYSAALKLSENLARGGARSNKTTALTRPPKTDAIVAVPMAFKPCPAWVRA